MSQAPWNPGSLASKHCLGRLPDAKTQNPDQNPKQAEKGQAGVKGYNIPPIQTVSGVEWA